MTEQVLHGSWKEKLEDILDSNAFSSVHYLVDERVYDLHELSLPVENLFLLNATESKKSIDTATQVWEFLSQSGAGRGSLLVSIGGGLTTDLGGFAASTYMRGMDSLYIPSTVLGMVDASLGGKTGVNFTHFKNRIGTFHKARYILLDTHLLSTLSDEQWLSGWAELVKHALIKDREFWLRASEMRTVEQIKKDLKGLLSRAVGIKQDIVEKDFTEQGVRKKLNFGHTVGHALESLMIEKGQDVPHGFAVAAGMMIESDISHRMGGLAKGDLDSIRSYLSGLFPHVQVDPEDISRFHYFLEGDKKKQGERSNFTLLKAIGKSLIDQSPGKKTIELSLQSYIDEYKKL